MSIYSRCGWDFPRYRVFLPRDYGNVLMILKFLKTRYYSSIQENRMQWVVSLTYRPMDNLKTRYFAYKDHKTRQHVFEHRQQTYSPLWPWCFSLTCVSKAAYKCLQSVRWSTCVVLHLSPIINRFYIITVVLDQYGLQMKSWIEYFLKPKPKFMSTFTDVWHFVFYGKGVCRDKVVGYCEGARHEWEKPAISVMSLLTSLLYLMTDYWSNVTKPRFSEHPQICFNGSQVPSAAFQLERH